MNLKGIPCSVCQEELREGDDIVVCPDCGAPYHRACYHKQGHCTFAAQHGNGFEYKRPGQTEETRRCPNCGTPNAVGHLFCENCGVPLSTAEEEASSDAALKADTAHGTVAPQQVFEGMPAGMADAFAQAGMVALKKEYDGISTEDWVTYIGNSAPYYLYQFDRMDKTNRKTSICWSALFFSPVYFFFRKVWSWGIFSTLLTLLLALPTFFQLLQVMNIPLGFLVPASTLSTLSILCSFLSWAASVFFGLFAFWLFRRHAAKKMQNLKFNAEDDAAYQASLQHHAGPSKVAVAVLITVLLVGSMLLSYWIGPERLMRLYYY